MRNIYIILIAVSLIVGGCVDDYTDANPPRQLDGPSLRVSSANENALKVVAQPLNKYTAFVTYGAPVQYTVSVIKAPGKVSDISVSSSIVEFGTVTLDDASVAALIGQESGQFNFTFTPSTTLPNQSDRSLNIEVNVSDSQLDEKGEPSPVTSTLTIPVTLVNGPCLSNGIIPGTYEVTSASGNLDGNVAYNFDALKELSDTKFAANKIVIVVTQIRPGVYTFNEVTGGVWPLFYATRANPSLRVNLCGNTISARTGFNKTGAGTAAARTFTLNGTLNNDGTISMAWSYVRDDGSTPANPAKGTYTLSLIP